MEITKKNFGKFSLNPSTPYALTHSTIDSFLKLYYKQFKFPYIIGRFSNFYGKTPATLQGYSKNNS